MPGRTPVAATHSVLPLDRVEALEAQPVDVASARLEDEDRDSQGLPPRYALSRPVAIHPVDQGTWEILAPDTCVWRLRIASPGALSLSLGFSRYRLPRDARLLVYALSNPEECRMFTEADNETHQELWTPVILSDDVMLELTLPSQSSNDFELELTSINVGYRLFGEASAGDKSGVCNIDVVCPEGDAWREEINSVGVISIGGTLFCTGFMVNNTARDQSPYFMTANHCGITSGNAASMVVYWNFESPTCGAQGGGSLIDAQTGATFCAAYAMSDFTLVKLDDPPDPWWQVAFAGWDRSSGDPTNAVTIHHPDCDEKSISFENDPCATTSYLNASSPGNGTHLRIADWDLGTTEPGSSGSPLFNQVHRVVGQLHGGYAACGNSLSDWYGRFSVSWTGGGTAATRLQDWLDPLGTGVTELDLLGDPTPTPTSTPTSTATVTATATPSPMPRDDIGSARVQGTPPPVGLVIYGNRKDQGMAGLAATAAPSTGHTLCHFHCSARWYTGIAVSNPDGANTAWVHVAAHDSAGTLLDQTSFSIPPNGKISRLVSDPGLFSSGLSGTGWMEVTSDIPVTAFNLYGDKISGGIGAIPSSTRGTSVILPHFHTSATWWTGIAIANPNDSQDVTVDITAYDDAGAFLDEATVPIPAQGKFASLVEQVLSIASGQTGWIQVHATGGDVAGLVIYGDKSSTPSEIAALPSISASNAQSFSAFRSDGIWWTGIAVVNPDGASPAHVTLTAFAPDGTPIDAITHSIPPRGKTSGLVSDLFNLGSFSEGWVEGSSDLPLVGMQLLHASDATAQAWGLAGVESQSSGTPLTLTHYDETLAWWTLLALANPHALSASPVDVTAYRNDGVFVGSASRIIPPKGRMAELVQDLLGLP